MFTKILELIKKANNIAIITHDNADGDAIGSALMLREFILLNYQSKNVDIFTDTASFDNKFKTMIGEAKINSTPKNYHLAFSVDCADTSRFEKYYPIFANADTTINIDHHQDNAQYADYNFVSATSSNCENLYNLFKSTHLIISKRLLSFACVGVITDTNWLSNPDVTADTFALIREFLKAGVEVNKIQNLFFKGKELSVFKLISTAMYKAEFLCDNKVLFINLNNKDLSKCGASEEQVGEIINLIFGMSNCLSCFLVSPRKSYWHISMRCVQGLNINIVAKSMGGGGHICASAANTRMSINNIKLKITQEMTKQLENYIAPNNYKLFE